MLHCMDFTRVGLWHLLSSIQTGRSGVCSDLSKRCLLRSTCLNTKVNMVNLIPVEPTYIVKDTLRLSCANQFTVLLTSLENALFAGLLF